MAQKFKIKCEECGIVFESTTHPRFADKKTCSPACEEHKEKRESKKKHNLIISNTIPLKYQEIDSDKNHKKYIGKSVFVNGVVGTGKTVFIAAIAKGCVYNNIPIRWISFPAFIMSLQKGFGIDGVKPYEIAEEVALFEGTLFIDDLGAEKLSEYVRQITYYILNEREQRMLNTVISSNLSLNDINISIDARISSRICGMCEVLNFKGKDRRLNNGKDRG